MLVQIQLPTILTTGKTLVTTAGNEVLLTSPTNIQSICIKALISNTGLIYVGDSSVSSTNGFQLSAGDSISLDISNTGNIWIDSSVNGEGCTYIITK